MRRRFPRPVLALWAVAALLVLLAVVLFAYGRFGGTTPTSEQPYVWDGQAPLVVSHQGELFGEARDSWCEVRPDQGETRRLTGRRYRADELRVQTEPAWFSGTAEVTCQRAAVLDGPLAPFTDHWFAVVLLALGVTVVSAPVLKRARRRRPDPDAPD